MCTLFEAIFARIEKDGLNIRFAFCDRNEQHAAANALGEAIAGCKGINTKVFTNLDAAITWIKACYCHVSFTFPNQKVIRS